MGAEAASEGRGRLLRAQLSTTRTEHARPNARVRRALGAPKDTPTTLFSIDR
jgi:hypothetical protein